jgi:hypothetical protein
MSYLSPPSIHKTCIHDQNCHDKMQSARRTSHQFVRLRVHLRAAVSSNGMIPVSIAASSILTHVTVVSAKRTIPRLRVYPKAHIARGPGFNPRVAPSFWIFECLFAISSLDTSARSTRLVFCVIPLPGLQTGLKTYRNCSTTRQPTS